MPASTATPEYRSWQHMKSRCLNPRNNAYKNYGARGITVCAEWLNDFAAFLAHVGPRPTPSHTIERIDNSRGYEAGNVRWATRAEQQLNLRTNHLLSLNGRTQPLAAWAREIGITPSTLSHRLGRRGWSVEKALRYRDGKRITFRGRTLRLSTWCRELKVTYATVRSRLDRGWSIEKAFGEPRQKRSA